MKIVSRDEVLSWVSQMDGILLNSEEALYLGNSKDLVEAEENLKKFTSLVVIKLGSKGAMAVNGNESAKVPAVTTNVVDTTWASRFLTLCRRFRGSLRSCHWGILPRVSLNLGEGAPQLMKHTLLQVMHPQIEPGLNHLFPATLE